MTRSLLSRVQSSSMSPSIGLRGLATTGLLVLTVFGCDAFYDGTGKGAPAAPVQRLPEVVQECTEDGTVAPYGNIQELYGLLEGQWEYCEGTSPLSRPGAAGIELRPADGLYDFLERQPDGSLTRMTGFDAEGDLVIQASTDDPSQSSVFFGSPANFITKAEFTVGPRKLRFNPSIYVFRGSQTSVADRCAQDGALVSYSAEAELKSLVSGRWAYCGGVSPLSGPGDAGIEIDAEGGQYYFLKDDGNGGYIRETGFDAGGSLQVYQPQGSTEWRLLFGSPANFDTGVQLMSNPDKLQLAPSVYVRIP